MEWNSTYCYLVEIKNAHCPHQIFNFSNDTFNYGQ